MLLWTRQWAFKLHNKRRISWLTEQLLASRAALRLVEMPNREYLLLEHLIWLSGRLLFATKFQGKYDSHVQLSVHSRENEPVYKKINFCTMNAVTWKSCGVCPTYWHFYCTRHLHTTPKHFPNVFAATCVERRWVSREWREQAGRICSPGTRRLTGSHLHESFFTGLNSVRWKLRNCTALFHALKLNRSATSWCTRVSSHAFIRAKIIPILAETHKPRDLKVPWTGSC